MRRTELSAAVLARKAVVYVRQSNSMQVVNNQESQRRQYELVEVARDQGFRDIEVIDDDLGRTASGAAQRPGFDRLVTMMYENKVGAVLCLDATRLARNGRDWEQLLEVCGFVGARIIDLKQAYDPTLPNDRLLLGLQGTFAAFELSQLHHRMSEAAQAKARRGELRLAVPPGFIWDREEGLDFDPDELLQSTIREVFERFRKLGSARQVLLSMKKDEFHFPGPSSRRKGAGFEWHPIRYYNVMSVLKNPFYAGAYAYGKTGPRTSQVDGRLRKSYGHPKPPEHWNVLIRDHHAGYIQWEEFERNQEQLAANNFGQTGRPKSGRGGRALLAGLLSCAQCGRRLHVSYGGRTCAPTYSCRSATREGRARCVSFGSVGVEAAVTGAVLRAVSPLAIEAALEAQRQTMEEHREGRRLMELELEQARYEASLAERRYAACDPDNRLIAARLEKIWEEAERRVADFEARLAQPPASCAEAVDFTALADDLEAAWSAPGTTMRARQRLLRSAIEDIIAGIDEAAREITLVIHWRGGRHSQLRIPKRESGAHTRTSDDALKVIASMTGPWSDAEIAATLNRMGIRTGQGNTWTARRIVTTRSRFRIGAERSETVNEDWLTMSQAAEKLGVANHTIRRLIDGGIVAAEQAVPQAPWRIRASDMEDPRVIEACRAQRTGRPCRDGDEKQLSMFSEG